MKNTLDIECLMQAIEEYSDAKASHDKARDEYQGYSWGYFGASYVNKMEAKAEKVQEYLDKYIEIKIKEYLVKFDNQRLEK